MIAHSFLFTVRYSETDQMKIAHHSNHIIWFENARIEFMEQLGILYSELEKQGYLMPVVEVNVQYFQPALFSDSLKITTSIMEKPGARLRFDYQIFNCDDALICRGYSLHGFMNMEKRAIKPPKVLRDKLKQFF